jgi:DNA-directed RNA polymerase subunit alpha
MVETMLIDLKALMVEREDCDAGTVEKLRNGLAQGKTQYRTLREVVEALKKKVETAQPASAKKWHLKLGIASYFLGHLGQAVDNLKQGEGALANFYLGKALLERQDLDEALKAFDKAEKSGYTSAQVQLQKAGIHRLKGEINQARALLNKLEDQASHNAEYHFQMGSIYATEGKRDQAIKHFERAIELDPGHTGALFQLGHANDLFGNDD